MYYWVAKDKDGTETKFSRRPKLIDDFYEKEDICSDHDYLPKGTIKELLGYEPDWWDGPYEVDGDYYNPVGRERYIELKDELNNLQKMIDSDYLIGVQNKPLNSSIIRISSLFPIITNRIDEIKTILNIL